MSVEASLEVSSHPPANQQQQENPFQENGELRRKADYIISHSRISRTEVQIVDPDSPQPTPLSLDGEETLLSAALSKEESEAPVERSKATEVHSLPAHNGSVQAQVTVGQQPVVEAEVKTAETKTDDQPQTAEQVKLKSKKKCCSVQ